MAAEGTNRPPRKGSRALAEADQTPLEMLATTTVAINGEVFHIGKLRLPKLTAIARLVIGAAARMSDADRSKLAAAATAGDDAQANLEGIFALLSDETIADLFGVVLDRSTEWGIEHLGLVDMLRVALAVFDHNEVDEVQAAFLLLAARFRSSRS